ncbi:hypothetical protein TNCV_1875551 [Trichonephila clavipes]|nr:hypothetical protein TNCV_1875551 [Trichonephila clavipes]
MHARYCGPGTDVPQQDEAGGPKNELDALCRKHDIEAATLGAKEADRRFNEAAPKDHSTCLGKETPQPKQIPEKTPEQKPRPEKRPSTPQKTNPYEQEGPPSKHVKKDLTRDIQTGQEMAPPEQPRAEPAKKSVPVSSGGNQPEITVPLTNLHTGLYPNNSDPTNNPYWATNPLGRWDGGIGFQGQSASNYYRLQEGLENPTRPGPTCLIRPSILYDIKKVNS